ncbi:unnamed protein product [Urochloa humidicola]
MTAQGQAAPIGNGDANGTKPAAHFVFVPLNELGHLIPAVDTALLLATHGAVCTVVGTPSMAARVRQTVDAAVAGHSGLPVRLVEFPLDYAAAGLPEGADAVDRIDAAYMMNYYRALALLRAPIERHLRAAGEPFPTCIVSDIFNPWASELAASLGVPRLSFFSMSAFSVLCQHNLERFGAWDGVEDPNAPVVVPGLDRRVVVTRAQAPGFLRGIPLPEWEAMADYIERARAEADGVVMNTVLEMEPEYVAGYAAARGMKVWTVGPVSLHHQGAAALASRGSAAADAGAGAAECLRWLDGKDPGSVVYVSFGSIAQPSPKQLVELGLGLEASGHPFLWVVRNVGAYDAAARAFLDELEARVSGRSLVVRGWAPQAAILSHAATGGLVTHCGWNSTLEAVTAGLPVVTWPHFTDQFLNEKMAVEVLGIGVSVGVTEPITFVAKEVVVGRDVVEQAVKSVMGAGEEAEGRRRRARELAAKVRPAAQEGGSSHANLLDLVKRFGTAGAAA